MHEHSLVPPCLTLRPSTLGIANSHYTFFNLSASTQITTQQTFRMFANICETLVFAYLGLAVFQFEHDFDGLFLVVAVFLCLIGRACNIFPLSGIANRSV